MSNNGGVLLSRRTALVLAALLLFLALAVLFAGTARGGAHPATSAQASTRQTAFEYVGRIDQNGGSFVSYGYVTYLYGVDSSVLFTDPVLHDEAHARLTYYATASLTSRSVISDVFVLNASGVTNFNFDYEYPGATFISPISFVHGATSGAFTMRNQNVLIVQSPAKGLATNNGEMVQTSSGSFSYGGHTYHFGEVGLPLNLWFTGQGTLTDPVTPKSFVVGAGNAIATGIYQLHMSLVQRS